MNSKAAGGVFVAFAGVVLLIAGLNGTLDDVWAALVKKTPAKGSGLTDPTDIGSGSLLMGNPAPSSQAQAWALPVGYPGNNL